jgi:hypothetical protein
MADDEDPFGDITDVGSPDPEPSADSPLFGDALSEPSPPPEGQATPGQPQPGYGPPPGYSQPYGQPPPGYSPPPGYGQPGYPPYGYAPTGYAPAVQANDGNAVAALIVSIASFVVCPFVAAIVALVLAQIAKRDILASQGTKGGLGLVTAAKVIAWTNIALTLLFVLLVALGALGVRTTTA